MQSKEAKRKYDQGYNVRNRVKLSKQAHDRYIRHREERKAKANAYYAANKPQVLARISKVSATEEARAKKATYDAQYRVDHAEEQAAVQHAWYMVNSDHTKQRVYAWAKANPGKVSAYALSCRAAKAGAKINDFTHAQWVALQEAFDRPKCASTAQFAQAETESAESDR